MDEIQTERTKSVELRIMGVKLPRARPVRELPEFGFEMRREEYLELHRTKHTILADRTLRTDTAALPNHDVALTYNDMNYIGKVIETIPKTRGVFDVHVELVS